MIEFKARGKVRVLSLLEFVQDAHQGNFEHHASLLRQKLNRTHERGEIPTLDGALAVGRVGRDWVVVLED